MNFTSSQHYREVQIASGIFLALVSLAAAMGNGLLLVTIWKDPFKTFRTPTTFFIIGLAVADFLTGIIVCLIQASLSIAGYIGIKRNSLIFPFLQKAASVATNAYFCLYKAFKRHMRRLQSNNLSRVNRRQRQFTIVNLLLLMFVIVCTLPITVVSYLHIHHTESSTHSLKMKIAHLLSCNMLFLKFALDPSSTLGG